MFILLIAPRFLQGIFLRRNSVEVKDASKKSLRSFRTIRICDRVDESRDDGGATWADRDQSGPRYRGLGCSVPCAFLGHSSRTAYHELIKKPRTFSADLVAYRTYCRVACIVHRTPCTFPARTPPTFHHPKFLEIRPIYIRLILLSQLVTTYCSLSRGQLKLFVVISSTQATICNSYRCKSAKDSGKAKLWRLCQQTIVESEDDAALELRPPRRLRQTEGPVPQPISKNCTRCGSTNMLLSAAFLAFLVVAPCYASTEKASYVKPPPCQSDIYCHGELLHTIQMASIYKDSKTFVDMKMKYSPNETLLLFREFMEHVDQAPTRNQIEEFINNTFDQEGSEFEEWNPVDWTSQPKFLNKIHDHDLRKFASDLNQIWKMLGRKMKDDVRINEDRYSIIYVPNPVIVPGGRFREFYYWDSYWIVKGLLLSEMYTTVKGMLTNFVSLVDKIGFIPNGGRIYYARRSQPPMLIPMVEEYLKVTNDYKWLEDNLHLLEKEFEFWMTNRTVDVEVDGVKYTLARFFEESSGPRPESYKEDYLTSQSFRTNEEKDNYYAELKTAAESGWDFSSRWFILDGTNKGNLTNLKTRYIIPVDLNSIIYRNAQLLEQYNRRMGNETKAAYYRKRADDWKRAVTAVLWHDEVGAWLDYDLLNDIKRDYFYPTNVLPLWTDCYDIAKREEYIAKVLKYLEKNQIMLNLGGIPTTLEHSGEQWDYPNAWPPLQYFVIMSLNNTGDPWAQRLAYEISQRWVRSNWKAFNETHSMFEKYDATVSGGHGGGGEYEVQLGFGWSNGIIMDLLNKYGDRLTAEDRFVIVQSVAPPAVVSTAGQVMTGILALVISLAAGFIGMVVYKRRHYYVPGPSTMPNKRKVISPTGNVYRKRIAYTELKDMNND